LSAFLWLVTVYWVKTHNIGIMPDIVMADYTVIAKMVPELAASTKRTVFIPFYI